MLVTQLASRKSISREGLGIFWFKKLSNLNCIAAELDRLQTDLFTHFTVNLLLLLAWTRSKGLFYSLAPWTYMLLICQWLILAIGKANACKS